MIKMECKKKNQSVGKYDESLYFLVWTVWLVYLKTHSLSTLLAAADLHHSLLALASITIPPISVLDIFIHSLLYKHRDS